MPSASSSLLSDTDVVHRTNGDVDDETRRHKQLDDDFEYDDFRKSSSASTQPSLLSRTLHTLLTAVVCFTLGLLAGPTFHQLGAMTGVDGWYSTHFNAKPISLQHRHADILPVPAACPVFPTSSLVAASALQSNISSSLYYPTTAQLDADRSWQSCRVEPGVVRASAALSYTRPLIHRADGMPLVDVFAQMDEAFMALNRWPGTIDLLVRTHWRAIANMNTLFDSIELFWPKNLGRCIVVMDSHSQRDFYINVQLPSWCEVMYEEVNEDNKRIGYWLQQYSNFWSDNYTTADYVAIFDSDSALNSPVTPDMLFDEYNKVIMFADPSFEKGRFDIPNSKLLGNPALDEHHPNHTLSKDPNWRYPINLMNNLPLLFHRTVFESFREYCLYVHRADQHVNFEALNRWGLQDGLDKGSQMSALNNYWAFLAPNHLRDMVHVLWQDDPNVRPRMRIGAHLPLSQLHSQNLIFQPRDCAYKDTKEPNVLASTSTSNVAQAICLFTPPAHAPFALSSTDAQAVASSTYSVPAIYNPRTSPNASVNPYSVPGCVHHWPHASFEHEPAMTESLATLAHYQYAWYYVDLSGSYTVHDWWGNIKARPQLSIELYVSRAKWMQQITQRIRPRNNSDHSRAEQRRQQTQWNELIDFLRLYPDPQSFLPVEINV